MAILDLLFYCLVGLGLVTGIYLIRGKHGRRAACAGAVFLAPALTLLGIKVTDELTTDWKPEIHSDAEILGRWKGENFTLTLEPDGSAILPTDKDMPHGQWHRSGSTLTVTGPRWSMPMRFYKSRDALMLLPVLENDPDDRDKSRSLHRE